MIVDTILMELRLPQKLMNPPAYILFAQMSEGNALVQVDFLAAKLVDKSLEESVMERCFQYCQNGGCNFPIGLIKVLRVIVVFAVTIEHSFVDSLLCLESEWEKAQESHSEANIGNRCFQDRMGSDNRKVVPDRAPGHLNCSN